MAAAPRRAVLWLSTLVLAAAASLAAGTSAAASSATWSVVPSPNGPGSNELHGADGVETNQVWAVGRVVSAAAGSPYRSSILRFDGNAWAAVPHPSFPRNHALRGVAAASRTEAWAVGTRQVASGSHRTLAERWDGTSWTVVSSPNPNAGGINELNGVATVPGASRSIWAVGFFSTPDGGIGTRNLILRRAGGSWQMQPSPATTPEDHLEAVDATGPNDAWAVGWGSTGPFGGTSVAITLRWDGTAWRSVPVPHPSPIQLLGVAALAPNNVWAVGHTYLGGPHWVPIALHWDGASWSRTALPAFPGGGQLRDVVALSPTNVYAVGLDGEGTNARTLVLRWDGATWSRQTTPSPPVGARLFGAAAIAPSTVWGVGFRLDQNLLANRTLTLRTSNG